MRIIAREVTMRQFRCRLLVPLIVSFGAAGPSAMAAEEKPPDPMTIVTSKEKLGRKWSDAQRVDDCKVPEQFKTQDRPDTCAESGADSRKPSHAKDSVPLPAD
jgi:hypothetical protein